MKKQAILLPIMAIALLTGCFSQYGGKMSKPAAAEFKINSDVLLRFDSDARDILLRYLAGNARWEVRKEHGRYYAIRRPMVDGVYKTTMNGFYSEKRGNSRYQNRVLLSFGQPYGFGIDRGQTTRVNVEETNTVRPILESSNVKSSGFTSFIIFLGPSVNLEIMERQPEQQRTFTQEAFRDVCAELEQVLKHSDSIDTSGRMPAPQYYPIVSPDKPSFVVKDGRPRGVYLIEGWIAPRQSGEAFIKVFNTATGEQLSKKSVTRKSTRLIGWSDDGSVLFPYNSEIIVYEGDWDHQYEARFELWHRSKNGVEEKLIETTRMINGWQN